MGAYRTLAHVGIGAPVGAGAQGRTPLRQCPVRTRARTHQFQPCFTARARALKQQPITPLPSPHPAGSAHHSDRNQHVRDAHLLAYMQIQMALASLLLIGAFALVQVTS
jgi:hypothetical protein